LTAVRVPAGTTSSLAVALQPAHPRAHAAGLDFQVLAEVQLAVDQRAGDDRAKPRNGENAVDG
jgi:hypothetical protein